MNDLKLIQHSRPTIEEDDIISVEKVLRSGMVSCGTKASQFEDALRHFIGGLKAKATASGRTALILALSTLDLEPGDEVIVPTYVCRSVLDSISYLKCNPVIVDIDDDYCISLEHIKKSITQKTKAIIAVHIFGISARIDEIIHLARKRGIYVIEDCAHAIGGELNGGKLGSFGDISFFSFQATKVIASGEGGMLLINNGDLLANFDKNTLTHSDFSVMSDIQAAMGVSQMNKLQEFIRKRRLLAKRYMDLLDGVTGITVPIRDLQKSIYFRFPVQVKKNYDFNELRNNMEYGGIHIRKGVDIMLHQIIKDVYCPKADLLFKETVSLPIYPGLDISDVDRVAERLRKVL